MGFLDAILGGKRKLQQPAADRLFAMTTAQVHLEIALGLEHGQAAGIVFQQVGTSDFKQIITETEQLLRGAAEDTGTTVESHEDEFGYRWVVLRDPQFEDLVVSLNTVSTQLEMEGYGDRLLACVFPFRENGRPLYLIYNFKRGSFYPFVPAPGEKQRNNERELQLKAQIGPELPIEAEMSRWFPLWDMPV